MTVASTYPQVQSVSRALPGTRLLAEGRGWRAKDFICTAGPQDSPFEERHDHVSIAVVLDGSFRFRSARGAVVFSAGSLLLSGARETYECSHEHSTGDRCLSFQYEAEFFERLAVDCTKRGRITFPVHRLPQLPFLVPLVALAQLGVSQPSLIDFEELAYDLAARILTTCAEINTTHGSPTTHDERRVAAAVGFIEAYFKQPITIGELAQLVGLSPFHFLRTFRRVVGITAPSIPFTATAARSRLAAKYLSGAGTEHRARLRLRRSLEFQSLLSRDLWDQSDQLSSFDPLVRSFRLTAIFPKPQGRRCRYHLPLMVGVLTDSQAASLNARFGYRQTPNLRIITFMQTQIPFQITALPIEEFSSLLNQSDAELRTIGARRMVADKKPGFPCRVSLVDAEPGEEVLLVNFTHHDVHSPYHGDGPIFIRVKAETIKLEVSEVPAMIRSRLLSIRGYDSAGMMLIADVVDGSELEEHLGRFFRDPSVEYIHIHNARPGCYNCRVDRVR